MQRIAALMLSSLLLLADPVLAGRSPTPNEREKIEAVLKKEGFVKWRDVEFEDNAWQVEDAQTPDGREYDLTLDPQSLEIIERSED
jgi:hypothetical protein